MDFLETSKAIMWLGLAVLFAAGGLGFAYAMVWTGRLLRRTELDLHRTVDELVPIMVKAGVSMDQVNQQLGKVDVMMDSAVDMTESLDTTVRAVSHAITEPVKAVSSAVSGAAETARSFKERVAGERGADAAAGFENLADAVAADRSPDPFDGEDE